MKIKLFNIGGKVKALARKFSSMPTARDYVQNGLIAMWDGIENAGWGVHDASATEWVDIIGAIPIAIGPADVVLDDGVTFAQAAFRTLATGFSFDTDYSLEAVGVAKPTDLSGITAYLGMATSNATATMSSYRVNDPSDRFLFRNRYKAVNTRSAYTENDVKFAFSMQEHLYDGTDGSAVMSMYADGESIGDQTPLAYLTFITPPVLSAFNSRGLLTLRNVRIYNRRLTASEVAKNNGVDKKRFNLP